MIAGPSGSGESVFQLHLRGLAQRGRGIRPHLKRARMLYVNLEGDLKPRLEAIEQHHPGGHLHQDAMFPIASVALELRGDLVEHPATMSTAG